MPWCAPLQVVRCEYEFRAGRWFPRNGPFGRGTFTRCTAKTARVGVAFARHGYGGVSNPIEKTKLSALSAEINTMKAVNKIVDPAESGDRYAAFE